MLLFRGILDNSWKISQLKVGGENHPDNDSWWKGIFGAGRQCGDQNSNANANAEEFYAIY